MYKNQLCLATSARFGLPDTEQIDLFKSVGFNGFFVNWDEETDLMAIREHADRVGMYFQSVHAPFSKMDRLWYPDEFTEPTVQRLLRCLEACAQAKVPIMVLHAYITFTRDEANETGIANFRRVVEAARETGVKLAFENTEGLNYLCALMEAFRDEPHVGFCWDTGHEMCYNYHRDLLADFGDRLLCTHLNDNLGILDPNGSTTFHDDLHLLPFDGIADWHDIAARLDRCGFDGPLTFELKWPSNLNHGSHVIYGDLDLVGYLTHAYIRACKVAALRRRG